MTMQPLADEGLRVDLISPADSAAMQAIEAWVAGRPETTPFHRPAWVGAVARGTAQEALFLLARGGGGAICGLLPVNIIHSAIFGRAMISSGFAVGGGILADDAHVSRSLAEAALALARRRACPTVELRGGHAPGPGWKVKSGLHVGFSRALAESDEAELLAVPRRHRAELRKGLERGYRVTVGRDTRLRDAHYALYRRSVHNLGTPVFPRALFEEVLDAFGDYAEIMLVSDGDAPLSAALTLYHAGTCMPYWHGADRNARYARSNEVLYFSLMCHARRRGCSRFDFGRSKVGSGHALWKRTWGFEAQPVNYFEYSEGNHEVRDVDPLSPRYRLQIALWKRLPPAVADRIGPWIARGIG